ncbi:hypothetical protein GCM10010347_52480 [Streptomyces cirratus]|uniref:Uncharacterized protein n=1 Tax=Streptomyces cirratus TaxID=68187 RepID=A0ABQ3F391_9ACTN|nr:hypothetical protein GCM10010347_52480 [Streptomyces cirratus]
MRDGVGEGRRHPLGGQHLGEEAVAEGLAVHEDAAVVEDHELVPHRLSSDSLDTAFQVNVGKFGKAVKACGELIDSSARAVETAYTCIYVESGHALARKWGGGIVKAIRPCRQLLSKVS